jgi:hypothetical protein
MRTRSSYRVVKFIVNVRLIEKSVKSHVGSVYDIQKRIVGSTLRIERIVCASRPNVEDGAISTAFTAARGVRTASDASERAAAELCTSDVAASGAAMVDKVLCCRGVTVLAIQLSRGTVRRSSNIPTVN